VAFRPDTERLEQKQLLAAIDLVNIAGTDIPADPGPFGILEVGINDFSGTGYSSASLGDVNGDGFDDFIVGAPTLDPDQTPLLQSPVLGQGDGTAYLVFGSTQVSQQTFNWLNLQAQDRIGDLGFLGNITQNNPTNGLTGWSFNGLTIFASQNPNDALGASVAGVGDVNNDGFADFMIGAPRALDSTGLTQGGRAYLIYGSPSLASRTNKQLDLDNPAGNTDLNIITFVNNQVLSLTGFSVAGVGDVITDGRPEIAIGAPNATFGGLGSNGAVYMISGAFLSPARTQTVNLSTVGQGGTNDPGGIIFVGGAVGDRLGTAVAGAGNFDGDRTTANQPLDDIIMSAAQTNLSTGAVYLVYGAINLNQQAIVTNGVLTISVDRVLPSNPNAIPGAVFVGESFNDQTGSALSTAGDFNADGLSDILIGTPFFNGPAGADAGQVIMIFGRGINPNPPGRILGSFFLNDLPQDIPFVEFNGAAPNAQAGFSVSPTGLINNDLVNEIVIGSPGFLNAQGAAYLIPGNPDLIGSFNLLNVQNSPVLGTLIQLSQPVSGNFLGTSVSGILGTNAVGATIDADAIGDFVIGAPGFNLDGSRELAGGIFMLEGAFVPLENIVSSAITSPIGVGEVSPPFVVNPTTPDDLTIFILSAGSNTPGFTPPRDINPDTIVVQGVALPDPSTFTNEGDLDGDGIDDASFIFSPRSLLGLTTATTTLSVTARTLQTSPFPNRRYNSSAAIRVSGGGGGGGGTPFVPLGFGAAFENRNLAAPRFGERLVPAANVIGRAKWAPLPVRFAYRQFRPRGAFGARLRNFFHNGPQDKGRTRTLEPEVFTRGRFRPGVFIGRINHKGPVIGA
jgi:hypothetical protein